MSMIRWPSPVALPAAPWKGVDYLFSGILLAILLAVFGQVAWHQFVLWDDNQYVYKNPYVIGGLSWQGLRWAMTEVWASNWHPLTWLSHQLDVELWGLWAGGHHLSSLLLHAANTLLLYAWLRRAPGATWRSIVVAALFALHPLHVESVAWVSERKDVLSAFFWLLTMHAYLRYAERPSGTRHALVTLLLAASLMAKPMAVTLPVILLLVDVWPLRRLPLDGGRDAVGRRLLTLLVEKLPWLLLVVMSCAITLYAQTKAMIPVEEMGFGLRLAYSLVAYATYLWQMVWPLDLSFMYLPRPLGWPDILWSALTLSLVFVAAVIACRRHGRIAPLVGLLWYLITLLPVIGIIKVGDQAHADRYTYLPYIGIWLGMLWAIPERVFSLSRKRGLAAVAVVAVVLCAALAWRQVAYWRDDSSLFGRALVLDPKNHIAYVQLGESLFHRGQLAAAEANALVAKGLSADPNARLLLGNIAFARGEGARALHFYTEAIALREGSPLLHYNQGTAHLALGQLDLAEKAFRRAIALNPRYSEAYNNLGVALTRRGDVEGALATYQAALAIDPNNHGARFNLARRYLARGEAALAVAQLQEILRRDPGHPQARAELSRLQAATWAR